jgi:AcrR family transcriptional regulator
MAESVAAKSVEPVANLQARIEEVAARLFITHGYNGVSYLDIARELGVTHSNIHYYYRTKAVLADAVLQRVAAETVTAMQGVWAAPGASLFERFVRMRAWAYGQYLLFNPTGTGARLWGLLSRFTMDADSLTADMRRLIGTTLRRIEESITTGIKAAVDGGELAADAPVAGITLQISTLISATGQVTRSATSFERLDDLLRWTYVGIARAYGQPGCVVQEWPALPAVGEIGETGIEASNRNTAGEPAPQLQD